MTPRPGRRYTRSVVNDAGVRYPGERVSRRPPLRDEIYARLVDAIITGQLEPGEDLSEVALSKRLGVSRTPLREALFRLEQDGFVETRPARGFFVSPLRQQQARELYPLLWGLEGLALDLSVPFDARTLALLRRLATQMVDAPCDARLDLDSKWHDALVSRCGNERLLFEIHRTRRAVRRYEITALRLASEDPVDPSHLEIIRALNEPRVARDLVARHWEAGLHQVLRCWPAR